MSTAGQKTLADLGSELDAGLASILDGVSAVEIITGGKWSATESDKARNAIGWIAARIRDQIDDLEEARDVLTRIKSMK